VSEDEEEAAEDEAEAAEEVAPAESKRKTRTLHSDRNLPDLIVMNSNNTNSNNSENHESQNGSLQ
jgi:hypothetical protein